MSLAVQDLCAETGFLAFPPGKKEAGGFEQRDGFLFQQGRK